MTFLHLSGVLHNDLKSRNVLVDSRFRAKVADFGLSSHGAGPRNLGTPLWMAPELLKGDPASPASDVYAFGIVCWELVARDDPYADSDLPLDELLPAIAGVDVSAPMRPTMPRNCDPTLAALIR